MLIVEGVTGAGKTSLIREIERQLREQGEPLPSIVLEDDTLGDIMDQSRDPAWRRAPTFEALDATLDRIESTSLREGLGGSFVVERFHLTTYALFPQWEHLRPYDDRLARMSARSVLLVYPEADAVRRSLDRPDRVDEGWREAMIAHYGGYDAALEAIRTSQRRRVEALALTRVPTLPLDSAGGDFSRLAARALAFWRAG